MSDGLTATGSSASMASSQTDELLFSEVEHRRLELTETEYVGYCALLCRSGRLRSNRLRAFVWRDVVLGRQKAQPVPQLSDGIIRQFQEETRSQASQSMAGHSREITNANESFGSTSTTNTNTSTGHPSPQPADASESAPLPPRREEPAESDTDDSGWGSASNSGPSAINQPTAAAAAAAATPLPSALHRRLRHPSLEPSMPHSCTNPLGEDTANGGGPDKNERAFAPVRRRARSLLSRRVKADAHQFDEIAGSDSADNDASIALSMDVSNTALRPMAWYHLPDNCQPRVVEADIERSLWKLYPNAEERMQRRRCLKNTILRVLLHNKDRFYYQGLHELMGFVMYVLRPHLESEEVVSICEALLLTRWRQFSERRLKNSEAMLYAVHAILAQEDPPLAAALEWAGVGPESHYAVSWVITWYVHSLDNIEVLTRLFDYFIADATGAAVIYFTAAFVMAQRSTIFEWIHGAKEEMDVDVNAPEAGDDGVVLMARVYAQLSRLPGTVLQAMDHDTLEGLIAQAEQFSALHEGMVWQEEENFLRGEVKKLGMLSNKTTRNAALRLLWHFLPREWRSPAKVERVQRFMFWTGLMVAATAMVVGTAAAEARQGGRLFRHIFH